MVIETALLHCFFCGRRFPADLEAPRGGFIHAWKVAVCPHCIQTNRDGLSANHPAIRQLAERGIKVDASGTGIVPWPDNRNARSQAHL